MRNNFGVKALAGILISGALIATLAVAVSYLRFFEGWTKEDWAVFWSALGALGTVLYSAATLYFAVWIGRGIRKYEERERKARESLTLDVKPIVNIHRIGGGETSVLETVVTMKNLARKNYCIPAVYVSARPLLKNGRSIRPVLTENDFDGLPDFETSGEYDVLSMPRNLAYFPKTVMHVSPDEVEAVRCAYIVSRDFVKHFPVLVISVEVFGAAADGVLKDEDEGDASCRSGWIEYMNSVEGQQLGAVVFEREPTRERRANFLGLEWHLLRAIEGRSRKFCYDPENTKKFRPVLESIIHWSYYLVINLTEADSSKFFDEELGRD